MRAGAAGWDYDVQAQSIQARLLDLNSIMPGALRRLDMSRFAAATARLVGSSSADALCLSGPRVRYSCRRAPLKGI